MEKKGHHHKHPVFKRHNLTLGQKAADVVTKVAGSWLFIISMGVFLLIWMTLNMYMIKNRWDPYPFILLNFVLSTLAAVQAPVILMSQNREAERDRSNARYDYLVNRKAEREIANMQRDLNEIKRLIKARRK
ncbi:DUF1003 domain-containing protein [Nanoarchaeota archaeon]